MIEEDLIAQNTQLKDRIAELEDVIDVFQDTWKYNMKWIIKRLKMSRWQKIKAVFGYVP